jgi:MacB-like periplasmic core domain
MKSPISHRRHEELEKELRSHLELAADDGTARGQTAQQAAESARREFGNPGVVREVTRDQWGWRWLEHLIQDVRHTMRVLRHGPGFAAVAILTIAIGIGASTTIFSWIHTVLLNPIPGAGDPQRVVALETLTPDGGWKATSYLDFRDFREHLKLLDAMSVAQPLPLAVGNNGNVERMWGEAVSWNFFEVLGVKPALGRFFSGAERDEAQNAHPVVVISHGLWTSRYHSDPAVIGAQMRISKTPYTIIGVAPADFHGSMAGLSLALWAPATMYGQLTSTGDWMLRDRKTRMFRRSRKGVAAEPPAHTHNVCAGCW